MRKVVLQTKEPLIELSQRLQAAADSSKVDSFPSHHLWIEEPEHIATVLAIAPNTRPSVRQIYNTMTALIETNLSTGTQEDSIEMLFVERVKNIDDQFKQLRPHDRFLALCVFEEYSLLLQKQASGQNYPNLVSRPCSLMVVQAKIERHDWIEYPTI